MWPGATLPRVRVFSPLVKTGRAVVIHEGFLYAGVGAEIVARIQEACFDVLDAPVLRVTNRDIPQPYSTNLEKLVVPSAERIVAAVRQRETPRAAVKGASSGNAGE